MLKPNMVKNRLFEHPCGFVTLSLCQSFIVLILSFFVICALRDKDELMRFWDPQVKCRGHAETEYGQKLSY